MLFGFAIGADIIHSLSITVPFEGLHGKNLHERTTAEIIKLMARQLKFIA